jgi:cytochrome c-type biogenesis protein CcmH
MRTFKLAFIVAIVLLAFAALPTFAQGDDPPPTPSPNEVNAIAENLYCPVCENIPLDVCATAACAQWRQQIADLLAEGYSQQEIYDYFAAQYGDAVLAAPPARGFNWAVYILPPLAIMLGAILTWRLLRGSRRAAMQSVADRVVKSKYLQQVEKELEEGNS